MISMVVPFQTDDEIRGLLDHFGLKYEESKTGLDLRGYNGAISRRRGDIVVRREMFGGSADMGFIRQADGSWQIECESMDRQYVTQLQNAHLYRKVETVARAKRRNVELVSGTIPKRLERNAARHQELVLFVPA